MDETASGALSGAASGASVGTSISPGWGTLIGGVVGAVAGGISGDQQKKARKKAEQEKLGDDPGMTSYLNTLRQRQAYAENGQTRMAALKRRMAEEAGAQTQANLARGAGGSSGTYIDSMLRSQNLTQRTLAQNAADTEATADRYLFAQAPLVSDMADRRLSLGTYARDVAAGQGAQAQQNQNANLNAALGLLATMDFSGQGANGAAPTQSALSGYNANAYNGIGVSYSGMPSGAHAAQPNYGLNSGLNY